MAMRVLSGPETVQGSPEWLIWRTQGIGASDAPVIMGKSLYLRAYELFKHKTGQATNTKPNPILQKIRERGHQLEPVARSLFERLTGNPIAPLVAVSERHPFIRASFDGYDSFSGEPTEIKCPGARAHSMALAGYVPEEYIDQLQHQMYVCESDWANYFSYDGTPGSSGVHLRLPRDQKRIDEIVAAEILFWERVQTRVWETDEWAAAATQYLIIKREIDELKEREELARQALIDLMPPGYCQREGSGVLVTRSPKKGEVEYSRLLADKNVTLTSIELDQYRKPDSDVVRVTVTVDLDVGAIDPSPLQMPKAGKPVVNPDFERYPIDFELVI